MLLRITSGRGCGTQIASYLLRPGGRRQPISRFLVHGASSYGSRTVKSKFEDLMTPSSRKRFSSNSPSPTQPSTVQLEVNPDDPLAPFNDEINKEIIARNPSSADFMLYTIIEVGLEYKEALLDESYARSAARQSLFKKYDQLPAMILDAWEKKDFKPIRTLRILQKNPPKRHLPPRTFWTF